jgi:threonine/homoserine/homoserine lactone efflux protein
MNRETIIVYTIAALIGSAFAYLVNIPTGIVAGLSTIGATVLLWHAFDTVRGAVDSHYSKKYTPKADEKKTSAL